MLYQQEIIDEVRSQNDIVDVIGAYLPLRPKGGYHFGLCPFHHEKSPSFSVSADKQIFYCFGCGAGGNVISFIMRIENFDFIEAFKLLADRIHYPLPMPEQQRDAGAKIRAKEIMAEIHIKTARFFYDALQSDHAEARAARVYLDERGVRPKTRVKYGLGLSFTDWDKLLGYLQEQGYTPKQISDAGLAIPNKKGGYYDRFRDRLMFPILDTRGKVIGFGGRIMGEGEPKYLNSPETPLFDKSRHLYGLNLARKTRAREMILVEGYMDVISLYQAGFENVAGVLGTALGAEHTRLLKRINCESVILLLDSDEAGTAAVLRAIPELLAGGIKVKVLQVTDAKDPDEYIKRFGPARFAALMEKAQSHIAFRVGLLRKKYALDQTEQRVAFTQETAKIISSLESAIEADAYIKEVAAMTGISAEAIRAEAERSAAAPGPRAGLRAPRTSGKGLNNARGGLLQLLLSNPAAGRALERSGMLLPNETGDDTAARLLEIAFECGQADRVMPAADAIARFEALEEQQKAADYLRGTADYDSKTSLEKALNEMAGVIKRAWLTQQIEAAERDGINGLNAVKTLHEARRNLEKQYITMTDG